MDSKKKILFITSSLNLGGAERQLLLLCSQLRDEFDLKIISLDRNGPLLSKYQSNFPDLELIDSRNLGTLSTILKLRRVLRLHNPDAVITWLYKADILGGIAAKLTTKSSIIWSARNSSLPRFSKIKKVLLFLLSMLIPDFVVANGSPALNFHKNLGYSETKLKLIPNFISTWTHTVNSNSQLVTRTRPFTRIRIGIAARQVSGKGILETIEAIKLFPAHFPEIELTIIGQATLESAKWVEQGLYGKIQVESISADEDLSEWFRNLDLYLMPSTAWESQPNSLIEAIAIGCPVLCSNRFDLEIELPESNLFNPLELKSLEHSLTKIFDRSGDETNLLTTQLKLYIQHSNDATLIKKSWISLIEKAISKETK